MTKLLQREKQDNKSVCFLIIWPASKQIILVFYGYGKGLIEKVCLWERVDGVKDKDKHAYTHKLELQLQLQLYIVILIYFH